MPMCWPNLARDNPTYQTGAEAGAGLCGPTYIHYRIEPSFPKVNYALCEALEIFHSDITRWLRNVLFLCFSCYKPSTSYPLAITFFINNHLVMLSRLLDAQGCIWQLPKAAYLSVLLEKNVFMQKTPQRIGLNKIYKRNVLCIGFHDYHE